MKLIYQESPMRFQMFLTELVDGNLNIVVGPTFNQQTKKEKSIPDLAVIQRSYSVLFETKVSDWYYEDQIYRHFNSFSTSAETKILFLLSNFEQDNLEDHFRKEIETAKDEGIILKPVTFEDFIGLLQSVCASEYLKSMLEEFKNYLDRNGLLPKWKYMLDVVNCSATMHEVDEGVYMCPDTGGAYSHRRAKYFGAYANKRIADIFEIKAIVSVEKNLQEAKIKWNNVGAKELDLLTEAKSYISKWRVEENKFLSTQVFLLQNKEGTNFIKETSGGMFGSKKYFWDIALDCNNSADLATKLRGRNWGDFQ